MGEGKREKGKREKGGKVGGGEGGGRGKREKDREGEGPFSVIHSNEKN